jgi:hypothetical protein
MRKPVFACVLWCISMPHEMGCSFDMTWTTQKTTCAIILSHRNTFTELLPSNNSGILKTDTQALLWEDVDHIGNDVSNNTSVLDKDKTMDNVQKRNICTNVPSSQTFRSYQLLSLHVFVAMGVCLPSHCLATGRGLHIQTHRWIGEIYEVCHWSGLSCHDIRTKFRKDWFRHSKVFGGGIHGPTGKMGIA